MCETVSNFQALISNLERKDFVADTLTPVEELKINANTRMKCKAELYFSYLQAKIVKKLEEYEPVLKFRIDPWRNLLVGGGISCVLQDGQVFEKAGVNISVIHGKLNANHLESFKRRGKAISSDELLYFATGISIIIHPKNPFVPSIHANYRYFETFNEFGEIRNWWFGGGCDLTPVYLNEKDAVHFHKTQKEACDKHDKDYYAKFKKTADEYHYNKFRDELRGIGGFMFDDMNEGSPTQCFNFVESCGQAFLSSYIPIVDTHAYCEFNERHVKWQQHRRGRYVEFNLLCDRGVKFGLLTPGIRVESILMSLPLTARWEYMADPEPDSDEDRMLQVLKKPRDWI